MRLNAFCWTFLGLSSFVWLSVHPIRTLAGLSEEAKGTKVAEGEYAVFEGANGGGVGPSGEEVYNFRETWTLRRDARNGYEIEGQRRFESPDGTTRSNRFVVQLSRDLTITRITEFARLKWRPDSGPLTCEFLPSQLHCLSNAKERLNSIVLRVPMEEPFGLLWPISAFSLGGITRQVERDPNRATRVQLVSIEQPSQEVPVSPMILGGKIRYLGEENIDVAGRQRDALKFSLKVALHPELVLRTSPRGLLLQVLVERGEHDWPEEGLKLLHFQEWEEF
jgi:hypothetical protein